MKKRLVYFGSQNSLPPLKTLYLGGYDSVFILKSQKFRGQKNFTPVQKWAESQLLSVYSKVLNDDTLKEFQSLKPDVAILFAYGKIVPSSWLTHLHGL